MDPLSDALRAIQVRAGVFFSAHMAGPWAVSSPDPAELARALRMRTDCIALFHLVVEGRCWLSCDRGAPVEADAGAAIVFPRGESHIIASHPGLQPMPLVAVLPNVLRPLTDQVPLYRVGAGEERTTLVCGFLRCDQHFNPLLEALPTMLVASPRTKTLLSFGARDGAAPTAGPSVTASSLPDPDQWLDHTFVHAAAEAVAERPGGQAMVARLVELLYVAVLRRWAERFPADGNGWIAGVRDPRVGRALRLLHSQPHRKWTVTAIAREAGLSRAALARRFIETVGEPPMRYLAAWRMQLAQRLLADPALTTAQVAARVGFSSDVAFQRAFKRHVGTAPAAWREALE